MDRTYISVIAEHDKDGKINPLKIKWIDGRLFSIDRILDVRQAVSLKVGGQGIRYTCRICNKQVYLFCDDGKWYIEK